MIWPFGTFPPARARLTAQTVSREGGAAGNEFRSAPLWGVGQRIFFLHDGRTKDLVQAIKQHASNGSEANGVVSRFNMLSDNDQQNLLNFLRSL